MNKRQKEVIQAQLDSEKAVLKRLERTYQDALADINGKIQLLLARQDADMQHVIYQVEYQRALRTQVQSILEQLQANEFETLSEYLTESYNQGFIGAMYDMQGQGVPLIMPIDQSQVLEAIQHETELSESLYTSLGHDMTELRKNISAEISRGISTGLGYAEIARNIEGYARIPKNRAMTIARTESHRIQCRAAMDAQYKAKENGADVVKQWDAALDGNTRPNHRRLDGQIRELDEPFEVGGMKAMYPGGFGDPAEDCNCRCSILQRAKWNLGEQELNTLRERAEYFGLDKTEDFAEYISKYMEADRVLSAPEIQDKRILSATRDFNDILQHSNGVPRHTSKMAMYAEYTEYVQDQTQKAAFLYDKVDDVIYYNSDAPSFDLYDLAYVQAHELTHRMDALEYNSISNAQFLDAVEICKERVMQNADKIQGWFEDGGIYENDFAISDIISALSNNSIAVPIGHDDDYWSKKENVVQETFANISAIDVLEEESKKEFESLFKELYEAYKGIVE